MPLSKAFAGIWSKGDFMEPKARILVVDDEADIRALLHILLETRGYFVADASSGEEAVGILEQDGDFDLVIMDIMMPGQGGIAATQSIRQFSAAPVLFLTAKTQLADQLAAFDSGGDGFLTKPFSRKELLVKAESLLRRYTVYKGKGEYTQKSPEFALDEERRCAVKHGQRVDLTEKEFAILQYLMEHQGIPLDARTIYEAVWAERYMPSSNNTVMVHVLNLRKKLEDDPTTPKRIRTIWGKGYQFG